MTITNTQPRYQFTGNGVTTGFAFPALFINAADLAVDLRDSNGTQQAGALNSAAAFGYSVVGTQDAASGEYLAGATITFNTAPPGGWTVTVFNDPPETQPLLLPPNGPLPPAGIATELDRLTLEIQALRDRLNRSLVAPVQDGLALAMQLPAAATRASAILGFDSGGQPVAGTAGSFAALLGLLAGNAPLPPAALPAVVFTAGGNYTAITGGYQNGGYIWVNRATPAALTLALPAVAQQRIVIVKDIAGDAGAAPIILTGTVDGQASLVLNSPYAGGFLVGNGFNWSQLA